jgi:hypothetical protein
MYKSSLSILCCLAAVCTATQAAGQLLEPVDVSGQGVRNALVYRDISATEKYYLMPLGLGLAKPDGKPALGVQYFRSEDGTPNQVTAALTLSIALEIPAAESNALKAALAPPGSAASIAALPLKYRLSYFLKTPGGPSLSRTDVSEGNLAAGATVALTLQVTDTKQKIRALLSGQNSAFGLSLQLTPQLSFGISRDIALSGNEIATEMKAIGYLAATPDSDRTNPALTLLRSKLGTWGAAEEAAARVMLSSVLGSPELTLDSAGKPRTGWDLTRDDLAQAFRARNVLRTITARPERPSTSLLFAFGDLCTNFPNAIVDLDEGGSGCGGLN